MVGSVNKVILLGRLGKDPDIRSMQNGKKVANISYTYNTIKNMIPNISYELINLSVLCVLFTQSGWGNWFRIPSLCILCFREAATHTPSHGNTLW